MDYCIFRFNKIKSRSMMKQVYDHHFRFAEPVNVDKEYEALTTTGSRQTATISAGFMKG